MATELYNTSDPWDTGSAILNTNKFNSAEAVRADERSLDMQKQAQDFNSAEAQKQRDYEERLSGSAVSRAAADWKNAGFSPLAMLGTGGASTPSGTAARSGSASGIAARSPDILGGFFHLVGTVIAASVSSAVKSKIAEEDRLSYAPLLAARTREANSAAAYKESLVDPSKGSPYDLEKEWKDSIARSDAYAKKHFKVQ